MRLRAGVRLEARGERWVLCDSELGREVPVGRLSRAWLEELADEREPVATLEALAGRLGEPAGELADALRSLLLLGAIAGELDEVAAAAAAAREAPRPGARVLPQARFGCQASGQCCRIFRPGPLSELDLAGLEQARAAVEERYPELAGVWVEDLAGPSEAPRRYLRRRGEGCWFLLPDHRCAIHAAAGFALKPEPCRAFPFDAVRTLHEGEDQLRVFDVGRCSAQLRASESGPSHRDELEGFLPLVAARPSLYHPLVLLRPGLPADYARLWPLEERLGELNAPGRLALAERLPRLLGCVASYVEALASCGPEVGAASRAGRAALEADRTGGAQASATPAARAAAWGAVRAALEGALAEPAEEGAPLREGCLEALALAEGEALVAAGLAQPSQLLAASAACSVPQERAAALFAGAWRSRLFGARLLAGGHLEGGLLRLLLLERLSLVVARARAAARGELAAGEADLEAGHWIAATVLDREGLRGALQAVGGRIWDLV